MKYLSIVLLLAVVLGTSCKKILDIESTRAVSEANMWNKFEDARAALFGIYALNRAALSDNGRHHIYGEVRLADFDGTTREDLKAIHNNDLKADYPLINQLSDWTRFYAVINAANIFLERSHEIYEKDPRYIEQNYRLDLAQAQALRAFTYFYIVRIWGDVPLILSSHDGDFEKKTRTQQDIVLAQAEQDLLAAEPRLPYAYDGQDPEQTGSYFGMGLGEYGIGFLVSKQAVWSMLANLYAWKGDYAKAARYAKQIMDQSRTIRGNFRLDVQIFPLNAIQAVKVFRGTALTETNTKVFGIPHNWRASEYSFSGTMEELTLASPLVTNRSIPLIYVPKDTLLSIYNEAGDNRFGVDTISKIQTTDVWFTGFDKKYPIFKKIVATNDQPNANGTITYPIQFAAFASATIFSRFEDNALLLAEARAVLNDQQGAIEMLNFVRIAHALPAYNAAKNGSVIDAVFKERRREMIGEGWRWYDIIRYKKIKNNDPAFNSLIQTGGIYWPISRAIRAQNPLLTQYPYWQ